VDAIDGDTALHHCRLFAAIAFYGVWLLGAALGTLDHSPGRVLCTLAGASAGSMWCVVDSLIRGAYWQRSFQWITFWLWPLGVPAYLVWSRGLRGAAMALLGALGVAAAVLAGELIAMGLGA